MTVAQMHTKHAANLLEIPGVVGVGTGTSRCGREGLKIYTTVSSSKIWKQLLRELQDIVVSIEYIGHINAHSLWYFRLGGNSG